MSSNKRAKKQRQVLQAPSEPDPYQATYIADLLPDRNSIGRAQISSEERQRNHDEAGNTKVRCKFCLHRYCIKNLKEHVKLLHLKHFDPDKFRSNYIAPLDQNKPLEKVDSDESYRIESEES